MEQHSKHLCQDYKGKDLKIKYKLREGDGILETNNMVYFSYVYIEF